MLRFFQPSEKFLVPLDALHRLDWALAYVKQWPVARTLDDAAYDEFARSLHEAAAEQFNGVLIGQDTGTGAFFFLHAGKVCGVRLEPGDLRGRDALLALKRRSLTMKWRFHRAPDDFAALVPIMASLVADGGRQWLRTVEPTMSAHLEALAEVARNPLAFLLMSPANAPQEMWLIFSRADGRIHRFIIAPDRVEIPTERGLDAGELMALFREQKASDELHQAVPRYYSAALLTEPETEVVPAMRPAEPKGAVPSSKRSRALAYVAIPLVVVFAALIWWFARKPAQERPSAAPAPAPSSPAARLEEELALSRAQVEALQREIARLREEMQTVRRSAPRAERAAPRPRMERADQARLDSLMRRIASLEEAIARSRAAERPEGPRPMPSPAATEPESAAAPPIVPHQAPLSPSQPVASEPSTPPAEEEAPDTSEEAAPVVVQPRAYTETLVDRPPELIEGRPPIYPTLARQFNIKGEVLISVLVSADGKVEQVVPLRGHEYLRQAAADAVRSWKFRPALLDGKPVPCWKTVIVAFRR